ncbi:Serine/threonine protein kinase [Giardia duodenalis]|uniref:non-specific serine/threonine protein kinase n=1 Tax=Giardia intestinalis TaxID=5741 RepID=V6TBQ5_GIAIN|nr:Serine/threonine protein kinase [Giardia intestinalis]
MARNFSCIYTIQHTLADVPFGVLHRIRRNFDDKLFCARELEYADTCTSHHKLLKLDIDLLQKFKHNRIVRVLEVIHEEDAEVYYVIQEDATDKYLLEMLQAARAGHPPAEEMIWGYIAQLAEVLSVMHNTSYQVDEEGSVPVVLVHGNLATDIVHTDPGDLHIIKLQTLGVGREVALGWNLVDTRGSKSYIAPEIHKQVTDCFTSSKPVYPLLTPECDMWSLGALVYELCTGTPLIKQKTKDYPAVLEAIQRPITLPKYGEELAHLVNSLLDPNPTRRPSASQVLALPLVQEMLRKLSTK